MISIDGCDGKSLNLAQADGIALKFDPDQTLMKYWLIECAPEDGLRPNIRKLTTDDVRMFGLKAKMLKVLSFFYVKRV
jgi:hypothetical protein